MKKNNKPLIIIIFVFILELFVIGAFGVTFLKRINKIEHNIESEEYSSLNQVIEECKDTREIVKKELGIGMIASALSTLLVAVYLSHMVIYPLKKMIESNRIKEENEEKKKDIFEKDVYDSEDELYGADDEDNDLSDKKAEKEFEEDDSGDDNPDKVLIPNFNNSFAEYGQFVDLTSLDRANPQFDKIMEHK